MKKQNSSKFAFTLAEVLVTLGIIGVVAAMTIPTLMNNYQQKVFVTQLRKTTAELSSAIEKYLSDQRVESLAETQLAGSATGLTSFVTHYLKVEKNCGSTKTPCFADEYLDTLNFNSAWYNKLLPAAFAVANVPTTSVEAAKQEIENKYREDAKQPAKDDDTNADADFTCDIAVTLKSGTALCAKTGNVITLAIDTNGKQDPNIFGRDLFLINVNANGDLVDGGNGAYQRIVDDGWEMNY